MDTIAVSYRRHRYPSEIISHAVWLYHRFALSFRDVEDLLAEGGVTFRPPEIVGSSSGFSNRTRSVSV